MTPKFPVRYAALAIATLAFGIGTSRASNVISFLLDSTINSNSPSQAQFTIACSLPDESPKKAADDRG